MRAYEFITESSHKLSADTFGNAMGAVNTYDAQNQDSGSLRLHWRFATALAGAPHFEMEKDSFLAGGTMFHAYTDVEQEMLDFTAKMLGDTSGRKWAKKESQELPDTHTVSPVRKVRDYRKAKK